MNRSGTQVTISATGENLDIQQSGPKDPWTIARLLEATRTESGKSFVSLVEESPVLLVFLRHAGCPFCRESLNDIAHARPEIEANGVRIVLVHLGDREAMRHQMQRYGLSDLETISDVTATLYVAFGLKRGALWQIFGLTEWFRGAVVTILQGHGLSIPTADLTQMPGVFFIDKGLVVRRFRHRRVSDRPSYRKLCIRPDEKE
jgi:peroxiredoxin